jgi:hypothetical protein
MSAKGPSLPNAPGGVDGCGIGERPTTAGQNGSRKVGANAALTRPLALTSETKPPMATV